ncbi:MAG: DUF4351 domain-containing protein [Planctomycetota bacterium]
MTAGERILEEIRTKARQEGELEGERRLLLRQLRKRFGSLPADVEARIVAASEAELEQWAERVLSAQSLEGVFEDDELRPG